MYHGQNATVKKQSHFDFYCAIIGENIIQEWGIEKWTIMTI